MLHMLIKHSYTHMTLICTSWSTEHSSTVQKINCTS